MKVGVFLVDNISPSAGGNFSYYDKFVRAIDNHVFHKDVQICFVGRIREEDIKLKSGYVKLSPPFFYKAFRALTKLGIVGFFSKIFSLNIDLCNRADRRLLEKHGVDVLLFPKQFFRQVENFPFITMNWDAGHKSAYAFPEFLENFDSRELWYRLEMQKALSIFVESESSKTEFSQYFSIPVSKIEVVPLFPGGVVDLVVTEQEQESILADLGLTRGTYLYYPAQFWAHKNHYNLILAMRAVIESGVNDLKIVFSGSDKGNKQYVLSVLREHNLEGYFKVLNFVSNEAVYTLYKNAVALVMPTFLGPTNMPLLEARSLGVPVICSDLTGHREMCGEGALYADPANPEEWKEAILSVLNSNFRKELAEKAETIRSESIFTIQHALLALDKSLLKLKSIRKTFGY